MIAIDGYLRIAAALAGGSLDEAALESSFLEFPPIDRAGLDDLGRQSADACLRQPRLGWAIAAAADVAARRVPDLFLQSLAAWRLAYAAVQWVRPELARPALDRARRGFADLGEPGWLAACDWQAHALPWLSSDLPESLRALAAALDGLTAAGLDDFVPHCRLALAYAQLLVGQFSASLENIAASEAVFAARGDRLNMARCCQQRASALRRQGKYEQAAQVVAEAGDVFQRLGAQVDWARAQYVLAYSRFFASGDWQATEELFAAAARVFHAQGMPLWEGPSLQALAQLYMDSGRMRAARAALERARDICSPYRASTMYADILVDSGRLEMYWGSSERSLRLLEQAVAVHSAQGSPRLAAIAAMYLGLACTQFNHYQRALQHLESAQAVFQAIDDSSRLAECQLHQALAWSRLGHLRQAERALNAAGDYYRASHRADLLASVHLQQAELYGQDGRFAAAAAVLEAARSLAQQLGDRPLAANIQRLLGETYLAQQQTGPAYKALFASAAELEAVLMPLEAAAAQVALGNLYAQTARFGQARLAWRKALRLSVRAAPDIAWRAEAGLARLAERQRCTDEALTFYRRMGLSLSRVRRDFLQPALAGSYLQRPAAALDAAVALAAAAGPAADALFLIEESKAQTLAAVFLAENSRAPLDSSPLNDLTAEIRRLQEQAHAAGSSGRLRTPEQARLLAQLRDCQRRYDEALSRLERRRMAGRPAPLSQTGFHLEDFRAQAQARLGAGWIALDYYLAGDSLAIVALTAQDLHVWPLPLDDRFRQALEFCSRAPSGLDAPAGGDLAALWAGLFPAELCASLNSDGVLLIAPHRRLHHVPWAALAPGPGQAALADRCIPVIAPSFSIQALLWRRATAPAISRRTGLVTAVSDFAGSRPPLPEALREAAALGQHLQPGSRVLLDAQASWQALQSLAQDGLDRFAFWHVASHAFHNAYTGRLGGIALAGDDLWLDRIAELAPLPALVTLSACSGMQTYLYEGDEPVGLAAACLAAGAGQVVAGLWPVRDDRAAALMAGFYQHWWAGAPAARALALAQRAAHQAGAALDGWGGFLCAGA